MRIRVLSLFALLLAACASELPLVPAADRATLIPASVRWPAQGVHFGLHPDKSDSAVGGGFLGLLQGTLLGLVYFPGWFAGGPFVMGPLAAREAAKCGSAIGQVQDAVQRFQRAGQQAGLAAIQAGLEEALADPKARAGTDAPASRYVMVIDNLTVRLDGTFESPDSDCTPALGLTAEWHLVRETDSQAFLQQVTHCRGPTRHASFVALFADDAELAAVMDRALRRLGSEVARDLREWYVGRVGICRL